MGNENSKSKELNKNEKIAENGAVNGISAPGTANVNNETIIQQNGTATSLNTTEYVIIESGQHDDPKTPDTTVQQEEAPVAVQSVQEKETSSTDQTDGEVPAANAQAEAENLKQESESLPEPERGTPNSAPGEEKTPLDERNSEPVENQEEIIQEENPVMNFFKTLVTPTKTSKKETATPDATKDQSPKEAEPAPATTVAQVSEPPAAAPKGMSIPPPPPPEPPKMEVKADAAAKPAKPTPKEEPKAAAKEPESSKGKSAKDTLSRFFRSKKNMEPEQPAVEIAGEQVVDSQDTPDEGSQLVVEVQRENEVEPQETAGEVAQPVVEQQMVEEVPQPVVEAEVLEEVVEAEVNEKVDPSKASTLEAAAKPEPPPPVEEEKKLVTKSSFLSFFKPKADEPKKATPAPAAAAEGAQTAKAKDEPKAAAKSSEAAVDNKPASETSQSGDDAAKAPKKLEKRNSIQLFFKNLGQKRHSTDAGVQTEPAVVAPGAEKAK